jgi:diketogulonate reductase-like aldo/keto reductase
MVYKIRTRSGAAIPNLGLGTWRMGENEATHREDVRALTLGLDLGLRLIDTAEMYADGGAERVVGDAIEGKRDGVFLVSKVLPHNASYAGTLSACERSLKRLRTSWIDLYLLHWPGEHPVEETLRGFTTLVEQGKIRHYGLSNFDLDEMERAEVWPGGSRVAVDQVLYNLGRRGIERRLIPWCASRKIAIMAYSPLEQGRLRPNDALRRVAQRHGATPAQIALAWTLRHDNVIAIPKAKQPAHVRDNAKAADFILTEEDLADIDRAFPPPRRDVPLDTL